MVYQRTCWDIMQHGRVIIGALTRRAPLQKRLNQFLPGLLSLLRPPDNVAAHISDGQDSAIPEFTLTLVRLIRTRKSSNRCFGEADCGLDPRTIGLLLPLGLRAVLEHRPRESGIEDALAAVNLCVAIWALGWNSAMYNSA